MFRAAAALLLVAAVALAADKDDKKDKPEKAPAKPVGTWSREASGAKILMSFKANNTATMKVEQGEAVIDIHASYGVTADGMLFGVVTAVKAKGIDNAPEKGDLFGFSFTVSKGEMTVSDLRGTKVNDDSRKLIEGVYSRK